MLSPKQFAEKAGISYQQVLDMCKKNEFSDVAQTRGGYYKIPEKNLDKYKHNFDYVPKEQYEKILKENERLKAILHQTKRFIQNLDIQ
jgi:predicted nucleotidyltransferase